MIVLLITTVIFFMLSIRLTHSKTTKIYLAITEKETPRFISTKPQSVASFKKFLSSKHGEMGLPVILPGNLPNDFKKLIANEWEKYNYNNFISQKISVHRSLPDLRDQLCKNASRSLNKLSKTDIIIAFHNEGWNTLLRTVHSILDRSPNQLIGNLILVDDFSTMSKFFITLRFCGYVFI